MDKRKQLLVIIISLALCIGVLLALWMFNIISFGGNQVELRFESSELVNHPGNYKQMDAYYAMGVSEGKLYICADNQLFVFEDGSMKELRNAIEQTVAGTFNGRRTRQVIANDCLYFAAVSDISENQPKGLYAYDLRSGSLTLLAEETSRMNEGDFFIDENKTLYIAADEAKTHYYPIRGCDVGDRIEIAEQYAYSDQLYIFRNTPNDISLIHVDEEGNEINLIGENKIPPDVRSYVIPCDNGILLHNAAHNLPLYYIEGETGKIVELFPEIEAMEMQTAVNIHNNYVYFSLLRYEKWADLGMARFENDTLEGTYRISLTDYSVEKISDHIYNGLFIFDDSGIYACNQAGDIYKLDFDGNRIMEIVKKSWFLNPED